jgi:diaminopimelate decarboxylase
LKTHKFGVPLDEMDKVKDKIDGLHLHIGSQITDVSPYMEAFSKVINITNKYKYEYLDIGGGWGINYNGTELNVEEYKIKVLPALEQFRGKLFIEPGRFIMGPSGFLLLKVVQIKKASEKYFVVLDGGMNVLIRPVLYSAHHNIKVLDGQSDEKCTCDFVGPLCET